MECEMQRVRASQIALRGSCQGRVREIGQRFEDAVKGIKLSGGEYQHRYLEVTRLGLETESRLKAVLVEMEELEMRSAGEKRKIAQLEKALNDNQSKSGRLEKEQAQLRKQFTDISRHSQALEATVQAQQHASDKLNLINKELL